MRDYRKYVNFLMCQYNRSPNINEEKFYQQHHIKAHRMRRHQLAKTHKKIKKWANYITFYNIKHISEIRQWCKTNCQGKYRILNLAFRHVGLLSWVDVVFEKKKDAMLFRLVYSDVDLDWG